MRLFHYDGWLMQSLSKIADLLLLSLLWIVSSIPLLTVGAASSALYYSVFKVLRKGEGGVWKSFWGAFSQNFKRATALWCLILVVWGLLVAIGTYAWALYLSGVLVKAFLIVLAIFGTLILGWTCFLIPYTARFEDKLGRILKNCFLMVVLKPLTALLLGLLLVVALFFSLTVPGLFFVLPGMGIWVASLILERVFLAFLPA